MKKIKERIAKVLCFSMLLVSLASSAVVAAPASAHSGCDHVWKCSNTVLETVQVVVNENYPCTICGARISLFQDYNVYLCTCTKCPATTKDKAPAGPIYSTHPCYN